MRVGVGGTHMENGIKTQQKVEVRQQTYSLLGVRKSRKLCNTIRKRKGVIPFAQKWAILETVLEPGNGGLCHQCGKKLHTSEFTETFTKG